jgi:hypothetical protein
MDFKTFPHHNPREASFSLLETIIAVSLVAILMVEVSGVQGNSIAFSDYGRKALQASYLAKRIMSQIEYNVAIRTPIKDIGITEERDRPFEDAPDFTYSLKLEPLPHAIDFMFKILSGGMAGDDTEGSSDGEGKDKKGVGDILGQLKPLIQQSVGEDPIWIARVSVGWTEGARKSTVDLSMMIADVKKLEDVVGKAMDAAPLPTENASGANTSSGTTTSSQPASGASTQTPGGVR